MLNIQVNRDFFIKAIQIVEKAAIENKIRPVLSGIFLEAKGKLITLKGSDLEITIRMDIPGEVKSEGKVVFPYHLLVEYIKASKASEIELKESDKNTLIISTQDSTTEIQLFDSEEFPQLPSLVEGIEYYLNKEHFIEVLEKTKIAAAPTSDNLAINCVRLELTNKKMKLIATDSFRMVYHQSILDGETFPEESIKISIPLKTIDILVKSLKSIEGEALNLRFNNNQVLFTIGEVSILSRITDMDFPNYQGILDSATHDKKIFMTNADFISVLKRILIFVRNNREAKNSATFDFKGNKLHIRGVSDFAKIKEIIDTLKMGDDMKLSMNVKFILDFIEKLDTQNVELSLSNASRPVFVKGEGNDDYIYLTMPLVLREE